MSTPANLEFFEIQYTTDTHDVIAVVVAHSQEEAEGLVKEIKHVRKLDPYPPQVLSYSAWRKGVLV